MSTEKAKSSKTRKIITSLVIGGIVGFVAAFAFMQFADDGVFGNLDNSREIAALVGLLYIATAAFVGFGVANPSLGAKMLNVEDGEELREQRQMLGYSAFGMFALGASLFLAALAAPLGPVPAGIAVAGVVLLIGLSWLASFRQRKFTDELMRSVSRETSATGFYLMFLIGGGWALLAHAGMVLAPQPLDWLTMFAAILLLATYWVCGVRGLLNPR